jgi:hypothetical protein
MKSGMLKTIQCEAVRVGALAVHLIGLERNSQEASIAKKRPNNSSFFNIPEASKHLFTDRLIIT